MDQQVQQEKQEQQELLGKRLVRVLLDQLGMQVPTEQTVLLDQLVKQDQLGMLDPTV